MPCNFDVLSFNARGIEDSKKRRKMFNYMKKNASTNGIIFLQETHSCASKDSIIFSDGASSARGVLIAFRESLEYKILQSNCDNNGRHIILSMLIQGSHQL